MKIFNATNTISNELKLTLFAHPKAIENFPLDRRSSYTLFYFDKIYKIRDNILDYSDYLSKYFENNSDTKELKLTFKYATSIQALDMVMKLLFGFEDVLIPAGEYIQVLAFLEELSITIVILLELIMKMIRGERSKTV